jgi:hypothetical protein
MRKVMSKELRGDRWLSFHDLVELGIISNWESLRRWQDDPAVAFPRGKLFGRNTRRWSLKHDIEPWIESRPALREKVEA